MRIIQKLKVVPNLRMSFFELNEDSFEQWYATKHERVIEICKPTLELAKIFNKLHTMWTDFSKPDTKTRQLLYEYSSRFNYIVSGMKTVEEQLEKDYQITYSSISKEDSIIAKLVVWWLIKIDHVKDLENTKTFPAHLFRFRPGFSETQKQEITNMKKEAQDFWEKLWERYDYADSKLRKPIRMYQSQISTSK